MQAMLGSGGFLIWNEFAYYKWQITLKELAHQVIPIANTTRKFV